MEHMIAPNTEHEKKKRILRFFKSSKLIYLGILIAIIILAIWIRTVNIPGLKMPDGNLSLGPDLDPFLFLRIAKEIVQYGHPLNPDMMRGAPLGIPAYWTLNIYGIVWLYKFLNLFSSVSIDFAAIIFPVICFAIAVLFFFLFVRKLFMNNLGKDKATITALIASTFFAIIPSMLHRTIAGVPEHEGPGIALFFMAFYFIMCAWKAEKNKNAIIFSILAGLSTGAMALTWGGFRYIYMTVALATFIAFFFNKVKKKEIMIYFIWLISAFLVIFISGRMPIKELLTNLSDTGFACFIAFILIIDLLCKKTKLTEKFNKIPSTLLSLIISLLFVIVPLIIFKPSFLAQIFSKIINGLVFPFGTGRISLTVAENKVPYFSDVIGNFGLLFWTFFIGLILIFYETTKHFNKKEKILLNLSFVILLLGLLFTRISSQSILNGENGISIFLYIGSILLFIFILLLIYLKSNTKKDKTFEDFKKIDFEFIFLIVFAFWMMVSIKSGIRVFFIIGPAIAVISSFLLIKIFDYFLNNKDELKKILFIICLGIVCLMLALTFVSYINATYNEAKQTVPGVYEKQWYGAMTWVKNNTPENSIFAHWWDYGYWVQTIGNRPTIADGGHPVSYWEYLIGRHVLTGQSEQEALEFLYAHNSSYLLIDSSDIGKYPAYSSIGSDENYDRLSSIGTFWIDDNSTKEAKNRTLYVYVGGWGFDEDIIWNNQLYPAGKAVVAAVVLPLKNNSNTIEQPNAIVIYQGKQIEIPIKKVYFKGKEYAFEDGLENEFYIIPQVSEKGFNEIGGALYIGERGLKALWTKLYLLNESENFKLVHAEEHPILDSLRTTYHLNIGDFLMYGSNVLGPIKIWEIEYPTNFTVEETKMKKYLQKESDLSFALW